jgi:hypothetical protein
MNDDMLSSQSLSIEAPRRDRITAISSAVQRRPIVLVLGMHRSGTSLCSHLLSALGVDMADNISGRGHRSPTPDNPRGHWERWEIVEFHDRILGLFDRNYEGCFHDFALPVAWRADPRVAQIRREIVAFLESRMGDGYFGFKDPRTVRLMPVWHQIFNELKLAPKLVLCLRNPAQVARSLHARDGLDPANGEYRWLVHMIDFYRYTSNFDYCAVEYEKWFNNPSANIEKLREFLDLPWQQSESDLALLLSDLVDPTARHDDPGHREADQPLVRTLYRLAGQAGQEAAARDQIAYIVSQFVSFQQLQRPLLQAFEDVAKTAAKYPETEREAATLRALVGERDADIASAALRANAAEASLADALVEIEGQRARIAELGREREDHADIEREANELKATLGEREAALRHAEREVRERDAAAEAIEAKVEALRETLAKTEAETQHRAAAERGLQAEVEALRERLAQAKRETQQHAAAERTLQAEAATLRGRLVEAEGEATERRAAAALGVQIAALQETLTAAREVGKAAVAAFRLDIAAPAMPHRPGGWRRGILRLFGAQPSF